MATEQEVLDDLIQAITNTNTSNDDFLKVLKEGRDQDVALRDGTIVPSLTKRVVNAFSNSDYLMKADNLASVIDKQEARANLEVYSKIEVDYAISSASSPETPNATETTAGKAKIATTAIAQAGVNDTDFITAKKLQDVLGNAIKPRSWSDVTASRIADTWYTNTTGNDIGVFVSKYGLNISASVTVRKTGTSTEVTLAGTSVGNNLVVSSTGFWEVPDGFDYKISPFNTVMELRV